MTNLMKDKKGIIIGVANERSICWDIAKQICRNGARVVLGYTDLTADRVKKLADDFNEQNNTTSMTTYKCDVLNDSDINGFFDFVKSAFGNIDFIVCAPAFTNKENLKGEYMKISRAEFLQTMDVSVYSLTAICNTFSSILNDNGSVLTLSYYGAEKIVQNYNIMGVAKSALEASVRYLASDLGTRGIRVNSISAGAVKTLASSAIGGFRDIIKYGENTAPLKRNITQDEISKTALFLLSDLSSGITAENIHVDCGLNAVGFASIQQEKADE